MAEHVNLLSCPMCGKSPDLLKVDGYHMVMCSCGVNREGTSANICLTAWNRRAASVVGDDGLPPLPAQPEELRARWKCEDCDGNGHTGEMIDQGYWQPPEPCRCSTCDGAGWVETAALLPEQSTEYARSAIAADRAARAQQQARSVDTMLGEVTRYVGIHADGDMVLLGDVRAALIAYIDGRTAGAAPRFNSDDELVAWLDTLHECDGNGAVHNRKWEPAQRAIKGIRAIEAKSVSGMDRAELQIEVFKLRAAINATELEGGYKLVPLEPTEAMIHAAEDLPAPRMFGVVYRAMIAAAPSPQPGKEGAT